MSDPVAPPRYATLLAHIHEYERLANTWHTRGKKIKKRYMDRREEGTSGADSESARRYNVLWSNVETLKPLLYSATPKPEVSRRFLDTDKVGNAASQVLERALAFTLAEHYFGSCIRQAVVDYLLPGRGTVWARYVPHFAPDATSQPTKVDPDNSVQLTDDAGAETVGEMVAFEEAIPDFVHWDDFGHSYGKVWEEVTIGWRRVKMTRAMLKEHFGAELAAKIPMDGDTRNSDRKAGDTTSKRATIYEMWDKETLTVAFLSKHYPDVLSEVPDPLELSQFFPFPRPLYATLANDGLIPTPDYVEYQDQAQELDDLTARIGAITKALRVVGVYDSSVKELERIFTEGSDNRLIPVENWAGLAEKGGLKGAIELVPMIEIAQTLLSLYEARDKVKGDLYEITGMSDIIRGNTDPRETATAQKGKIRFATMRLDERQREVQRFARNVVVILGNIIASKFGQDTLAKMTGVKMFETPEAKAAFAQAMQPPAPPQEPPQPGMAPQQPMQAPPMQPPPLPEGWGPDDVKAAMDEPTWAEVMKLLRDEPARTFRIDIETDSTVANDQEADKQEANEFLQALGGFLGQAVKAPPSMVPLIGEMLKFAIRRYPIGRELEARIDSELDKIAEQAAQPQQGPPPDPMIEVKKAELQQNGQRDAATHQLNTSKAQDDHAFRMATLKFGHDKAMAELALKREEIGIKRAEGNHDAQHDLARLTLDGMKAHAEHADAQTQREHEAAEKQKDRETAKETASEAGQ